MWGGLNNQKQCIVPGLQLAQRLNYTFVLPHWKLDFIGEKSEERGVMPFSYLYQVEPLRRYAARYSMELAEQYTDMPEETMAVCIEQLSRHYPGNPIGAQKQYWAKVLHELPPEKRPRAVCLNDLASIYHTHRLLDQTPLPGGMDSPAGGWMDAGEIRDALEPSTLFATEVNNILEGVQALFGRKEFVALHLRTELDWVHHCTLAPRLFSDKHRCFMDDQEVDSFLMHQEKLPKDTILFVCSDRKELPELCNTYKCFKRDDVWTNRNPEIVDNLTRETRAFLDYLLALRANAFYGQMHSTFSNELYRTFKRKGGYARYYNLPCTTWEECRFIPERFRNEKCTEMGNIEDCMNQEQQRR